MIPLVLILVLFIFFLIKRRRSISKKSNGAIPESGAPEEKPESSPVTERDTEPDKTVQIGAPSPKSPTKKGLMKNIRSGLSKTRNALSAQVDRLFIGGSSLDEYKLEDLEEMLITSDVGVETSMKLIKNLSRQSGNIHSADDLKALIKEEIFNIINISPVDPPPSIQKPHVIMVVGVNGVGKTTTIGKLASRFVKEGKDVLIVAADTFRAAASEQLAIWAERSGASIVRHKDNSDPAAVAYDGMDAALSRNVDIVIIDTAGRLHTKINLMEELKKIRRTVASKMPDAPHETLMVVDGTTGQNALQQAKLFNEAIGISSIALTKLDGTAKGGVVIGISHALNVPLKYIGVGEQIEDLQDFNPREFADAMI
ncbi:MAG: signal recognition particle-docking protein FtsY [Proteobacteria bacterium]|nr:signal recognition particle-docking protein FtsY [Pseudomonadota bacterium]